MLVERWKREVVKQRAAPSGDISLHLIGTDREQFGAFQKFVGAAETLLLGGPLFRYAWIFRRRLIVRRGPELIEPRLDLGQPRRDMFDAGADRIGDWRDALARGGEVGIGQIVALQSRADVVERGIRLIESGAKAREVWRRGDCGSGRG